MPRRDAIEQAREPVADRVLEPPDASLLDLLDRLLEKGVMANGDVTLGVAGVDLIYLRLATILCGTDRVLSRDSVAAKRKRRHLKAGSRRSR
jgi:gas vesicle structural protein